MWLIDQELLKAALKLADGSWEKRCLKISLSRLGRFLDRLDGWSCDRLKNTARGWLLLSGVDGRWSLVLYGSRLRDHWSLINDGDLDAKLELGLCSTVELFVNGDVVWVKSDKGGGTIGVSFQEDVGGWREREEESNLAKE